MNIAPARFAASPSKMAAIVLFGVAAGASVGAASAAGADAAPTVAIHYDPHSLATDSGVRTLCRRIVSAAAAVCPAYSDSFAQLPAAVRDCREQAISRAVLKINDPKLVAIDAVSAKKG